MRFPIAFAVLAVVAFAGCVPLPRDQACLDAEACDAALERPFGDFNADDPVFGDVGTCWQNADSQKPCILSCQEFLADQVAIAQGQGNQAVIDACGGVDAEE